MAKADRGVLLKEYELCQSSAQHLESVIWKTSAGIGVGTIAPMLYLAITKEVHWEFCYVIGAVISLTTCIW